MYLSFRHAYYQTFRLQIDVARDVIKCIEIKTTTAQRTIAESATKTPDSQVLIDDVTVDACNSLLVTYARKALEVPVVQPEVPAGSRLSVVSGRASVMGSVMRRTMTMPSTNAATSATPSFGRMSKVALLLFSYALCPRACFWS